MKNEIGGVVVGAVAAIVLVPIVRIAWQRFAPGASAPQLTAEARRRSAVLSGEALVVAFGTLATWAIGRGLRSQLDPLDVATAIGIILSAPFWWVLLRTRLRGQGALAEYARYIEAHDGISFRSLSVVSLVATAVAASCGLISYVRAG